jgi:hypothetical protein
VASPFSRGPSFSSVAGRVDGKRIEAAWGRLRSFNRRDSTAGRRLRDYRCEKTVDFASVSFAVDFECFGSAKIAHGSRNGESLGKAQHVVTKADALHAPGETDDGAHRPLLRSHNDTSRTVRRKILRVMRAGLPEKMKKATPCPQ